MKSFYTYCKQYKNSLLLRYIDENGNPRTETIKDYKPSLYTESREYSKYKGLNGKPLVKRDFNNIYDAKTFIYKNRDMIDIYGYDRFDRAFISEQWDYNTIKDVYDIDKISIVYLDIETEVCGAFSKPDTAEMKINAISFKETTRNKVYTFGLEPVDLSDIENVYYFYCKSESELLNKFLDIWSEINPNIYTGWNIDKFDTPYLLNRICKVLGEPALKKMSPFGSTYKNSRGHWEIDGVCCIDYMELYKKYRFKPRENYKLDHIANVEIGDEKLKHESGIPGHKLYEDYYEDFIRYNIQDVELLHKLETRLNLMHLIITLSYTSMVNFDDCMNQTRLWDSISYNELKQNNVFFKVDKRKDSKEEDYMGAYVKETIAGKYSWVVSFDVTSMYPSLIRALNISPETLINGSPVSNYIEHLLSARENTNSNSLALENNYSMAANGQMFDNSFLGFIPIVIKKLFKTRYEAKSKMIDAQKQRNLLDKNDKDYSHWNSQEVKYSIEQTGRKVQLNALYGALGNVFFRFYDIRMAEAVTMTGQLLIRWVADDMNSFINNILKTKNVDYVIASDTDSIYVNFGPFVDKYLKGKSKTVITETLSKLSDDKLQTVLNNSLNSLSKTLNCIEPEALHMSREAISDVSIFTGKKRYFMHIMDMEGVKPAKGDELKIMGVEAKKSSTPAICRKKMEDAFDILLFKNENDMKKFISEFKADFKKNILSMARNTSVNNITKYYDKDGNPKLIEKLTKSGFIELKPITIPQNSKAAMAYNNAIKELNLLDLYEPIEEGEKVKQMYIKQPNIFKSDIIAWKDEPPKELEIEKIADVNVQFEKVFLKPIRDIAVKIGWNIETNTKGRFF